MKTFVIIPAHNEEKEILETVSLARRFCKNIVVVDDGSSDKTTKNIKNIKNIKLISLIINSGKGAALRVGCDYAINKGAEKIIVLDADGQHDPKDIPKFEKLLNKYDIVFGFRKFSKSMPFIFRIGNSFISLITKLVYKISLNDTQCGYRAFRAGIYNKIRWKSDGYEVESEMISRAAKNNLKFTQQEIKTIYKDHYKGTSMFNGFKVVSNIFKWRLKK